MFMLFLCEKTLCFLSRGDSWVMYQIIKVLNNNAFLASYDDGERILLGKGIGFGKKAGDRFQTIKGARVFTLASKENEESGLNVVKGIDPVFLEAAGKIIEEAEEIFDSINPDILLPLADHIAFAAKREKEKIHIPNPFIADIKALFGREYTVVLNCRDSVEKMTGYQISDDEVGFIALHIHSGLSDEHVTETLKITQTIDECLLMVENMLKQTISRESLGGIRLMSHLYYMIDRIKTGEDINIELNEFVRQNYPKAWEVSRKVCLYVFEKMKAPVSEKEIGFFAVHIQTIVNIR